MRGRQIPGQTGLQSLRCINVIYLCILHLKVCYNSNFRACFRRFRAQNAHLPPILTRFRRFCAQNGPLTSILTRFCRFCVSWKFCRFCVRQVVRCISEDTKTPLGKFLRGVDVLRTGIEPVRALLPTGFSCYSCFYTSRLHPEC